MKQIRKSGKFICIRDKTNFIIPSISTIDHVYFLIVMKTIDQGNVSVNYYCRASLKKIEGSHDHYDSNFERIEFVYFKTESFKIIIRNYFIFL